MIDADELSEYLEARRDALGGDALQFEVKVEIEDDKDPDLSYLGEYVDERKLKHDEAFFDRALDRVFIDQHEQYRFLHPPRVDERCRRYREENNVIDENDHAWIGDDPNVSESCDCSDEGDNDEALERVENWTQYGGRGRYRYINSCNYAKADKRQSDDALTDDERRRYIEQDARRLMAYPVDWSCVGVVVKLSKDGAELGEGSVWGIETDSDDYYFKETAADLFDEALEEATKKLDALRVEKESVSVHRDVLAALLNAHTVAEGHYMACLSVSSHAHPYWLDTIKAALPGLVKKLDEVA